MPSAEPTPEFANVDRSDLVRRVLATNARLVTLTAPAGYGKSRFARVLLTAVGRAGIADCADMLSISTAVRAILRGLGPFDQDFEERQARYVMALPRDGSADDRWRDVLEEALQRPDGSTVLCVENGELLAERSNVAELVDWALRDSHRRFVLCSRIPLHLESMARIPPNERYQIEIEDLRFTDEEIKGLLAQFELDSSLVARAIDLSRGWPIAVLTFLHAAHEAQLEKAMDAIAEGTGMRGLGDYTLTQALGSLGREAREILAGAALLGKITTSDLRIMSNEPLVVDGEFATCPFVSVRGDVREIHPLAIAAMAQERDVGKAVLRRAAVATSDPVRAVELYLAAGEQDLAADVLDRSIAPFMMEQPTPKVAALVAALDEPVLLRHAETWNATWMYRGFTVSTQRMLFESRTVWLSLKDDVPLSLRFGVGMSLVNWLFFTGNMEEAAEVLKVIDGATASEADDSFVRVLLAGWRALSELRSGKSIDLDLFLPQWRSAFAHVPMTHAMALYTMPGPIAFFQGDRGEARRIFALSVDLTFVVGSETIASVVLETAAFFAWLAGEDALFASLLDKLRETSGPTVIAATSHFLQCATADKPALTPIGAELPCMRVYASLIAASREKDAARRTALLAAVDAATIDSQPWLLAVAWAALGLADPAQRSAAFDHAMRHAALVDYPVFRESIEHLTRGTIPKEWPALRSLVSGESPSGRISTGLSGRQLYVGTRTINLSEREAELLLALALHSSPRDRATLAAMIWPDLEEKDAANAVGVYVARLRRRLGDLDLVESRAGGYALRYPVDVDLLLLEAAIAEHRGIKPLEPSLEVLVSTQHERLPQWVLISEWLAPYAYRFGEAIRRIRSERLADAGKRGAADTVRHYENLLAAEQGTDD